MPQPPDSDTVMHCLDRAAAIHGAGVAELLADAMQDAWSRSVDAGPDRALIAAGWLSFRASSWRQINPAVSPFFDRLAELSADAWCDEITVRTCVVPDFPPDLEGDLDALHHPVQRPARPGTADAEPAGDGVPPSRHEWPGQQADRPAPLRQAGSANPDPEGAGMSILARKPQTV